MAVLKIIYYVYSAAGKVWSTDIILSGESYSTFTHGGDSSGN